MTQGANGAAVFVLLSVLGAARLQAAPSEEEQLLRKGGALREAGNEREASIVLQKAYDISRSPRAAAQLGLSELALGRWVEAEQHVSEALEARSDSWIRDRKRTEVLEESLRTIHSHLGTLEVTGTPDGAEVVVAGRVAGRLPLHGPVRAASGPVELEVLAPGYVPLSRTVNLEAGQYQRIRVRLDKPQAVPPPDVSAPAPTPGLPPAVGQSAPESASSPDGSRLQIAGVITASLGIAAVASGIAFNMKANNVIADMESTERYTSEKDSDHKAFKALAWVGYGVGAACVATGAILYGIGLGAKEGSSPRVRLLPSVGVGHGGAVLAGGF